MEQSYAVGTFHATRHSTDATGTYAVALRAMMPENLYGRWIANNLSGRRGRNSEMTQTICHLGIEDENQ